MHIKNIHCIIEKLAEVTKFEVEKNIETLDTKEMCEVAKILKELSEAEYYAKISKAMDGSEYGKDYDLNGPRHYQMTPEMYNKYPAEHYRDIDRQNGKMYYTPNPNAVKDHREGRSGVSRRYYMESKETNKDKSEKLKDLENYMKELSEDVTEMIQGASQEEKNLLKQKMQVLMQKF